MPHGTESGEPVPRAGKPAHAWTLVFIGAAWAPPTAPMTRIFEETLEDMTHLAPGAQLAGEVVDLGGARTISDDEPLAQPENPDVAALLPTIEWVPTVVLLEDGAEVERFEGMVPKLQIRERLLKRFSPAPVADLGHLSEEKNDSSE